MRAAPPGYGNWGLALSADAKRLAFQDGGGVGFFDLSAAKPLREKTVLEGSEGGLHRLAFAPDGKRLVGSSEGGVVCLWDLTNGQTRPSWKRQGRKGSLLTLSDDGRTVAYFSDERTVTLLDVVGAEPREIVAVPQPAGSWSLALSPDGKRLAVGFEDGKTRLWDVSGKTPVQRAEINSDGSVMRFSHDGKRLALAHDGVGLWDVERQRWAAGGPFTGSLPGDWYLDVGFAPDDRTLVSAEANGAVRFWDLSGEKPHERNPIEQSSYLMASPSSDASGVFSRDGTRLAITAADGLRWWNLDATAPIRSREAQPFGSVAVSPDGKMLLLNDPEWRLSWCDLTSGDLRPGEAYKPGDWGATRWQLMPEGKSVAVGTAKGEVLFAEREAGKKDLVERSHFRVGDGPVVALAVSPDGRMMATAVAGAVKFWDLTGDKPALRDTLQPGEYYNMVFSPNRGMFAIVDSGAVTVWDVREHPPRQRRKWNLDGEWSQDLRVAFSSDSRTLATAGAGGKLLLRDIETGLPRREWQLPGQINYVAYAPDGRHLLTINSNGTGYILRLAPSPSARVDDAWLKQVAALPAEKQVEAVAAKLKELNPGFDGKVTPSIENGVVTDLSFLTDNVTDISPVRALTGLKRLTCGGSAPDRGRLSDLSPLRDMKLTFLQCLNNGELSDLSPLRGLKLTFLFIGKTQVSDLSPLKDMKLTGLICYWSAVSDLSPLKGMPLTGLDFHATKVTDLSPLRGMPLKSVVCDFKPERDAEILRTIPTLETINEKPAKEVLRTAGDKK